MKAESSVFIAGEADARIENVTISNLEVTMCSQGTQASGYFDEQPSIRHVYPHSIPAVYARSTDDLRVSGRVRYEEPYHISKNKLYESEDCQGEEIHLLER